MLKEPIRRLAYSLHDRVISYRRHLHKNPELSFREYETSGFIKRLLDEMGIPWKAMADTGVVAIVQGAYPSDRVIALRADMDALPVTEENKVEYASKNEGIMHACGHDVHTASLLGTAMILQAVKGKFGGTVKLIFQPAEEKIPGGASIMIKEGVLEDPVPYAVIGQHCFPGIESGKIGIKKGKFLASHDELYVTVRGRGGHGASPQLNVDPVLISAHILVALQQIVSRMANPVHPTVLSFGKVIANGLTNVIPDQVYLEGTFRSYDEHWRNEAHTKMKKMAEGIAESMGGSCEFNILRGYPFVNNEEKLTEQIISFAGEYLGEGNIIPLDSFAYGEDFGYYSQARDSCFYFLGTGNKERRIVSSLHAPTFDIDEDALALSTGLMSYIAIKQLGNA
jgi:amidohydrolase